MIDDRLTLGPELSSKLVGRATTKNSTIGRVSTVPVTVDTRPISHVYTVHVARSMRITVGRV
jgi:hypothetical protein